MAMIALAALSGVAGIAGQAQQEAAAAQAANYNAQVQQQQATMAIQQAAEEERRARISGKKQIGAQRANISASGLQLEGSALDVLEESANNAELDALNIRHGGQMKAWSARAGAQLDTMRASSAVEGARIGAVSTLLGAGAAAYKARNE